MNDPARGRRALGQFVLIGLTLSIVAALMPHSSLGNRVGVATFGVLPIALGVLRPNGFWDAPNATGWRWAFSDVGVRRLYIVALCGWSLHLRARFESMWLPNKRLKLAARVD